ncbi:hypothetical protein [Corynebacterium appendicis]|uniref:hypothetical protein n=1 Tax=Corynebacterium appendicis TaxID=163202 RepID=UPI002355A197|nr:hypothetical protein [Corynebacterium appendicis]
MSWKSDNETMLIIRAPKEEIASVVTDVPFLPQWNPAFSSVGKRREDGSWPVSVHKIVSGSIRCEIDGDAVRFAIDIPGLVERSEFLLESVSNDVTRVSHRVRQSGPLSALIGDEEASLVPGKRLARLARVVEKERML